MAKYAWIVIALLSAGGVAAFSQSSSDLVSRYLTEDGGYGVRPMDGNQKAEAIAGLRRAQSSARGKQAQKIAFLLASLGWQYERNRDLLIATLAECAKPQPIHDCDEETAGLLIALGGRRDAAILDAMLTAVSRADGALAASLGEFFQTLLRDSPDRFLRGLKIVESETIAAACGLAATGDGGSVDKDARVKIRASLQRAHNPEASACLRAFDAASGGEESSAGGD